MTTEFRIAPAYGELKFPGNATRNFETLKQLLETWPDNEPWPEVVLSVLEAYRDRGKGLSDWWVWTHFSATFGRPDGEGSLFPDTWLAERRLAEFLSCIEAIAAYRAQNWLWRWWHRKLYRIVLNRLLVLGITLANNDKRWGDRFDFAKFKQSKGQ